MDFATLYATAPLGATIAFSDGTPQPPKHHKKKLSAWQDRNASGRLIGRQASKGRGPWDRDTLTLETGVYGSGGTIVLRVRKTFDAASLSSFEIAATLPPGSFAIVSDSEHTGQQLHAVRATRAAIEEEKARGFNADSYRIVTLDALAVEVAA